MLGLTESSQLVMTRIHGTVAPSTGPPVTIPGVHNVTAVATDPDGGWGDRLRHRLTVRGAPERLARVTVGGLVQPFGAELSHGWTVTGLAARPDGSGIAVALWHVTVNRLPGQIRLVPLPGHPGGTRIWTLSSALMTQARGLSWRNASHLTLHSG